MTYGWLSRSRIALVAAACLVFGGARVADSRIQGGSGRKGDCFAEFDNITSSRSSGQPQVVCEDGDPSCDSDGDCHNERCTFKVGACVNQTETSPSCTPPTGGLKSIKALPAKYRSLVNGLDKATPNCTATFTDVVVKTTKHNKKPGKQQLRLIATAAAGNKPKLDKDSVILMCKPSSLPKTAPCPVGTTSTTTTTIPTGPCTCAGGEPHTLEFTTGVGSGDCGHLDADGSPNCSPLKCGGLYFGGAGVGVPLPSKIPDMGLNITGVSCHGTTLTLSAATAAQTGGNRCSGGSNHHNTCNADSDCLGGKCKLLKCTAKNCLFGPPLPIPNGSHLGSATSTCVINTISQDAAGTADCSSGTTTDLNLPLSSALFLVGDGLPNRCTGGSRAGKGCSSDPDCPGGGTCANDTGRCRSGSGQAANTPCATDTDCTSSGTCETAVCSGGSNANFGCITDADCPGGTCQTLIQPCPICNATTNVCDGGPNDGLACTAGDTAIDGDFPTSHDCPPTPSTSIGALPIGFVLDTGTKTKLATDLTDQQNVFCGFCKNKITNQFKNPAVSCTANSGCAGVAGFTSCGQRTAGAFTANCVARTITETGSPAGQMTTGGAAKASTLVSIFCIPPTFNPLVDSAADLPGPGAVALQGQAQLKP